MNMTSTIMTPPLFLWRSHFILRRSQWNSGDSTPWGGVSEILVTQHQKKMTPHILHMTQTQFIMTPHEISTTPYIFPWLRLNRNFWLRQKRVTFCKRVIKWAWIIFFAPESYFFAPESCFFYDSATLQNDSISIFNDSATFFLTRTIFLGWVIFSSVGVIT